MTTALIHIGDFHAAQGPRNADRFRSLDQIVDDCIGMQGLGAWVWPGDIFDAQSHVADRNAIDARLQRMASVAPVVLCLGNHDKPGELDGFANLSGAHPIYVVDRPQVLRLRLATMQWASLFCLPYPHRAGLVGADVAHGDLAATAGALLDPIFIDAAAEMEAAREELALTAFFFHANVAGSKLCTGQPAIGREIELSPAHLARLGHVYKGGNHIHFPQEIHGAWYAGSTSAQDYGESEQKRYLVVRIAPDSSYEVESRPINLPRMFRIEGTLTRDGFTLAADSDVEVLDRFNRMDWANCDVRCRYSFLASERGVLDVAALEAMFFSAVRVKCEGVAIADREVRSPAVARAATLTDKLAAMRTQEALPDSAAAKVALLEQHDEGEVLKQVSAWLAGVERPARREAAAA